jgi:uncharacterized membrane protein
VVIGADKHAFVDRARVRQAILEAQKVTSAPIHVSIAPYFWGSVRGAARQAFRKHRLQRTPGRNGVLFFIVPSRHAFSIIGDVAAHAALGQQAWDSEVQLLQQHFRNGENTRGLILAIEEISRALAAHFPATEAPPEAR